MTQNVVRPLDNSFQRYFWSKVTRPLAKTLILNHHPEFPEEAVSDVLVVEGPLEQELDEVALEEALVLEGLRQLQQVPQHHVVARLPETSVKK